MQPRLNKLRLEHIGIAVKTIKRKLIKTYIIIPIMPNHPFTTFHIIFQTVFPSVVTVTRALVFVVTVPSITSPNPSAAEATAPADTLTADFWPPDSETMNFCCLSRSVCGNFLWQP